MNTIVEILFDERLGCKVIKFLGYINDYGVGYELIEYRDTEQSTLESVLAQGVKEYELEHAACWRQYCCTMEAQLDTILCEYYNGTRPIEIEVENIAADIEVGCYFVTGEEE